MLCPTGVLHSILIIPRENLNILLSNTSCCGSCLFLCFSDSKAGSIVWRLFILADTFSLNIVFDKRPPIPFLHFISAVFIALDCWPQVLEILQLLYLCSLSILSIPLRPLSLTHLCSLFLRLSLIFLHARWNVHLSRFYCTFLPLSLQIKMSPLVMLGLSVTIATKRGSELILGAHHLKPACHAYTTA